MGILKKMASTVPAGVQRVERSDGWANELTGIGSAGRDKRLGATFSVSPNLLTQNNAQDIWRGDDMGDRMVVAVPNEMLRAGFYVDVKDDTALGEEVDDILEALGIEDKLLRGLYYSRAYGGGAIIPGVSDGRGRNSILREDKIEELTHVNAFTPDELFGTEWYLDPFAPKYAMPRLYDLIPMLDREPQPGERPPAIPVHESRVIRFDGQSTSPEHLQSGTTVRPGWGDSIFVRVLQVIQDFQSVWQGAAILMQDFAPPVLKMKGLAELLANSKANPTGLSIRDRLVAVELSRSIARLVLLDKDEEFKRETTNISGLPEMLEKFMARLASAADMPVSLLVGQAPAGLNATGDSEIRWFYDRVRALQRRVLGPVLRRLVKLLFLSKRGPTKGKEPKSWKICFNPLWQMTDVEESEVDLKESQKFVGYVGSGILTPEEAAKAIARKVEIDFAARQRLMEEHEAATAEANATQNDPETGKPLPRAAPASKPPAPFGK